MKRKVLPLRIGSTLEYVDLMARIFSRALTRKEVEVLAGFVDAEAQLHQTKVPIGPFSTAMRKKVADDIGHGDPATLNTYIKRLKDKKAIRENKSTPGGYQIHPMFLLRNESEIVIQLHRGTEGTDQ